MLPDAAILEPLGSLAGIVVVVWFFLTHLTKSSKVHADALKQISETNRAESQGRKDEMMKHLDKNTDVIDGNSRVLGATSTVLGQATEVLRDVGRSR